MAQDQPAFPHMFCVKTYMGAREGYFLMRWSQGTLGNDGAIHIIKATQHHNRFYDIAAIPLAQQNTNRYTISSRKNAGHVVRPLNWRFTSQKLKYEEMTIPVLQISPMSALPSMKVTSFIPIINNTAAPAAPAAPAPAAPAPAAPAAPAPIQQRKYTIESIPQHIVRAILRDAVMQEEVCPITSAEIDIANGAVTSCFHLFEKNAICKWLSMPGSRDKCPVCNSPCNSYTLD